MTQPLIVTYVTQRFSTSVAELSEWLGIPSISADPAHQGDVRRAADWLVQHLQAMGFPHVEHITTDGHPLVYAEWLVQPPAQSPKHAVEHSAAHANIPTLLAYGHYDVQPADPLALWESPPFTATIRGDDLIARGANDSKGQSLTLLGGLRAAIAANGGQPPVNLKVLFEGEEENGGTSLATYVQQQADRLQADAILVCDTDILAGDNLVICTGLKGILYCELHLTGAKVDLHSGLFGGVGPNPLNALAQTFTRLKDEDGLIRIPALYTDLPPISPAETQAWATAQPALQQQLQTDMGTKQLFGEHTLPIQARMGLRPTLDIHGISGGYTGAGAKTVIPATASAKFSLRLPPGFPHDAAFTALRKTLDAVIPRGFQVDLTLIHGATGLHVPWDNPFLTPAKQAIAQAWGKVPVPMRVGGSIPALTVLHQALNAPVVMLGFGRPEDNLHAPNEKYSLTHFRKGMQTIAHYVLTLGDVSAQSS